MPRHGATVPRWEVLSQLKKPPKFATVRAYVNWRNELDHLMTLGARAIVEALINAAPGDRWHTWCRSADGRKLLERLATTGSCDTHAGIFLPMLGLNALDITEINEAWRDFGVTVTTADTDSVIFTAR